MKTYRSAVLSLALCFGTACASTETKATTPSYPEQPVIAEALPPSFVPDASLRALSLSCRPKELPRDNGLDDDCDGHVDGSLPADQRDQPNQRAQLVIALSSPNHAALALSVLDADGRELSPTAQQASEACDAQSPYTAQTRSYAGLTKGRYAVVARHVRACPEAEAAPSTLALSVETSRGASAFVARIEPAQTLTLGHLDVP